ncbi:MULTISPECIES: ABC transporter permease [Saccharopolyspora]|uniref:ABC transporter permease subunit n=1 Tax=Saccharopolyspora gregorii TaxID=33914 RepID=A0ABP6RMY0_9PSEU|nr:MULTISPECIES: ABC transporter permease [Saccharopolyspora]MCA1188449.1 ABC transporter permease [Saccharopolyspora sp. 6T]MCA1190773.1 ABC transporter permease [Saccharopolyspora sp. 6V]MCA1226925.1 ABC transporter permease [Saccharopolyspora sp. 6M]MCA1283344.1 ABC transporter permease [Saccharopolyspora sp. 7B]
MIINELVAWLSDPEHWLSSTGLLAQTGRHLYYCVLSVLCASIIAMPIGLWIGHTGRGGATVVVLSNSLRALPTLGLVTLFVLVAGIGEAPTLAGLVILAIPAVLSGAYAGVQSVPAEVRDAAKGMGMTPMQQLWQVELPNAAPLLFGGVRTAMLQVVATASVAAYVGLGGLGSILLEGIKTYDYGQTLAAALCIALLAVLLDVLLSRLSRAVTPRGIRSGPPAAATSTG